MLDRMKFSLALYGALTWPSVVVLNIYAINGWPHDQVSKFAFLTPLLALPVFFALDILAWVLRSIQRAIAKDRAHD